MDAVYGEEVRGSIHDAIAAMNEESNAAMQYASTAKDSAQASATSAAASASTATTKANAAATSASNAAASATTATNKASAAATSATNAASSESKAKTSETNAAASATTATQKATAAATSATNAASSETKAKTSETNAKSSETKAKTSETNAKSSETTTVQKAAEAAASEANAKASEQTAIECAASAVQNGELARISATSAKLSEDNAGASELAAQESAASAQLSAEQAEFFSGKPPKPYNGTWWIWDMDAYEAMYDSSGNPIDDNTGGGVQAAAPGYIDTGISCELVGPQGVGISDISLTSGDHSPGMSDVYTVTMTDGGTYTIAVWNGRNGSGAGDVLGQEFDLTIPASGWSNHAVTIADNRLIAQNKYKYYLVSDEACRAEFLDCKVQPRDITTDGFISFTCETAPTSDLSVNVTRLELSANG